jgi:hypothetical protein
MKPVLFIGYGKETGCSWEKPWISSLNHNPLTQIINCKNGV